MNFPQPFCLSAFSKALELFGFPTAKRYDNLRIEPKEEDWVVVFFNKKKLVENPAPHDLQELTGEKGTWCHCPKELLRLIDDLSFAWPEVQFSHISRREFGRGGVLRLFGQKAHWIMKAATWKTGANPGTQGSLHVLKLSQKGTYPYYACISADEEAAAKDARMWQTSFDGTSVQQVKIDLGLVELFFRYWDWDKRK